MTHYFDSDQLQKEIIAALNLASRPLSAGELTDRCPSSPEQQATSDTLRILKRKGQVILSGRSWSLAPGVTPDREISRKIHQALANPIPKQPAIDTDTLRVGILRMLRRALHTGQVYLDFYGIYHQIPFPVTRHRVSQLLDRMCEEGAIERMNDHNRSYKIRVNPAQSSLFSDLEIEQIPEPFPQDSSEAQQPAVTAEKNLIPSSADVQDEADKLSCEESQSGSSQATDQTIAEPTPSSEPSQRVAGFPSDPSESSPVLADPPEQETQKSKSSPTKEADDKSLFQDEISPSALRSQIRRSRIRNRLRSQD